MAQWGRNDQAVTANSTTTKETSNGAPIGTYALAKGDQVNRVNGANAHFGNTSSGSRAASDVGMFGNTTIGAFMPNKAVGVFGIDAVEMGMMSGNLSTTQVTYYGTGYTGNAVVTLTFANGVTNATAVNAFANVTAGASAGQITALNIAVNGAYTEKPSVTIAAPASIIFNGNSAVTGGTNNTITIPSASSKYNVGDKLTYAGNVSSTPGGLTDQTDYYVSFVNSTVLALSSTYGGANIALTKASGTGTVANGATITGKTATGVVTVSGAKFDGAAHAGWVLRTEGTGGRAGRIQYETLVAMGSLGAQTAAYGTPALIADASVDAILPDA